MIPFLYLLSVVHSYIKQKAYQGDLNYYLRGAAEITYCFSIENYGTTTLGKGLKSQFVTPAQCPFSISRY
jgi:hypothetical protein